LGSIAQPGSDSHLLSAFDLYSDDAPQSTGRVEPSVADNGSKVSGPGGSATPAAGNSTPFGPLRVRNETGLLLHVVLLEVAAASVQAHFNSLDPVGQEQGSRKFGLEHLGSWLVETGHFCVPHPSFGPPESSVAATGHFRDPYRAVHESASSDSGSSFNPCTSPQLLQKIELDFDGLGTAHVSGWNPGGGVILSTPLAHLDDEREIPQVSKSEGTTGEGVVTSASASLSPQLLWKWELSKRDYSTNGRPSAKYRELCLLSPLQLENYSQYDLIVAGCRPEWSSMKILGKLGGRERGGHARGAWGNGCTTLHVPATIASCTQIYVARAGILRPPCSLPPDESIW
jgi:hypothetical protein